MGHKRYLRNNSKRAGNSWNKCKDFRVQQIRFKSQQGTMRSFVSKEKGQGTKPQQFKMACLFCKEDHFAVNCDKIASVQERQELLRRARRCFCCLKVGHTRHVCRSDRKCKICNGSHHQVLC